MIRTVNVLAFQVVAKITTNEPQISREDTLATSLVTLTCTTTILQDSNRTNVVKKRKSVGYKSDCNDNSNKLVH